MELGLSTSLLPQHALPKDLALLTMAGQPWIEIHGYTPDEFDFGDHALVAVTKQTIARHGLRIWSCHSPAYEPLDLASLDTDLRMRSCEVMQQAMEASAELGARVFVCDAVRSYRDARAREAQLPLYAESLYRLQRGAARMGLTLVIENQTREWGPFTTPEDFLSLVTDYNLAGLGACWTPAMGGSPAIHRRLHAVSAHTS